jgi:hypothetical protein
LYVRTSDNVATLAAEARLYPMELGSLQQQQQQQQQVKWANGDNIII